MPNRLVSGVILIFWAIAAGALFTRDILPNLLIGPPPDLRAVALADEPTGPVRWSILAIDEGKAQSMRSVGQVTTETDRERDGWVRFKSRAWLDPSEIDRKVQGEPTPKYVLSRPDRPTGDSEPGSQTSARDRIGVVGSCEIDRSGNLEHFRVGVRLGDEARSDEIMTIEGRHKKENLEIVVKSREIPFLPKEWKSTIPYQPRGMVQNSLGPLDRMPGLQVGQKWETQVISPLGAILTGGIKAVQVCQVEVVGDEHIFWGTNSIRTLKVVTRMNDHSVATWVREDGLVVRQELPFPSRSKILLERLPDDSSPSTPSPGARR